MDDIAPGLLEKIRKDFLESLGDAAPAEQTYKAAGDYAEQVRQALSQAFQRNLGSDSLPDGKMYWNIAERVVQPMLEDDYSLASDAAVAVQQALNEQAGVGIKAQRAPIDKDRVDGILNRLCAADQYDDVAWLLGEPVVNFSRSVVDNTLKANAEFQAKAGRNPRIIRKAEAKCCEWCSNLEGVYEYPDNVPDDIYRRHENCRCTVEYDPGDGTRQNVHTKKWTEPGEDAKMEARKVIGLRVNGTTIQSVRDHFFDQLNARNVTMESVLDAINNPLDIKAVKYDEDGRPSFNVIGRKATVAINPETGTLITTHPTHTKTMEKLLSKGEQNEAVPE